jgi:hypothetical protein
MVVIDLLPLNIQLREQLALFSSRDDLWAIQRSGRNRKPVAAQQTATASRAQAMFCPVNAALH